MRGESGNWGSSTITITGKRGSTSKTTTVTLVYGVYGFPTFRALLALGDRPLAAPASSGFLPSSGDFAAAFFAAQRAFCASAIRLRPAALITRFLGFETAPFVALLTGVVEALGTAARASRAAISVGELSVVLPGAASGGPSCSARIVPDDKLKASPSQEKRP